MASMKFNFHVEMEDGKEFDVIADQRDLAVWEIHSDGADLTTHIHSASRFLAWNALGRKKLLKKTWEQFNDQCVEVTSNDEADEAPKAGENTQSDEA